MSTNDVAVEMESINTANFVPYNPVTSDQIKKEDLEAIKHYLESNDRLLILKSFAEEPCRTPLHDVCDCVDTNDATKTLADILDWYKSPKPPDEDFIHKLDTDGNNALHYAVKRCNIEAVNLLISNGATLYLESLSEKVRNGNTKTLQDFVDERNQHIKLVSVDKKRTLLHDICDCGNKEAAKKMLDKVLGWYLRNKKDLEFIDKKDLMGNTALHYALKKKNRYAVNELINCGASVYIA